MQREMALPLYSRGAVVASQAMLRAIVIALAVLVVFALLLLAVGKDPIRAYRDTLLYVFGNGYGFSELLVRMAPLLLTAVAVVLPTRLGLINVGGEGQLYMGAWLATAGALYFPDLPAWLLLPLMLGLGFVGGGLWALIPGAMRAANLVNETISTLLLNYLAPLIVSLFIFGPWRSSESASYPQSPAFVPAARLPSFSARASISAWCSASSAWRCSVWRYGERGGAWRFERSAAIRRPVCGSAFPSAPT